MPYLAQLYATHNNIESLNEEWFNRSVLHNNNNNNLTFVITFKNRKKLKEITYNEKMQCVNVCLFVGVVKNFPCLLNWVSLTTNSLLSPHLSEL
jgi:hypothetical protein